MASGCVPTKSLMFKLRGGDGRLPTGSARDFWNASWRSDNNFACGVSDTATADTQRRIIANPIARAMMLSNYYWV